MAATLSMTKRLTLAALALTVLLNGCSTLGGSPRETFPEVRTLLNQHQYGKALQEIDRLAENGRQDGALQKLRHETIYQAFRFEQQTIAEATTRQEEGDWRGAMSALDEALGQYPESETLNNSRKEFLTKQEKQLATLNVDLMLARAGWLLKQKSILVKRRTLSGDNDTERKQLIAIEEELQRLHEPLIHQGRRALKSGKLSLAKRCIDLAHNIQSTKATKQLRGELNKKNRQRASQAQARKRKAQARKREAQARESQARFQTHLRDANVALAKGDLETARRSAVAATEIDPYHPELLTTKSEIQRQITQRTDLLISEGSSLYRRGEFHAAQKRWAEAVRLDPENTLARARLERAERVIDKLERLRQQQPRH